MRRCCPPIIPIIEYDLPEEDSNILVKTKSGFPISQTDICELKDQVICEYLRILSELEIGRHPDIEILLEKISLIEIEKELDNREFIVQYYINI